MEIIANYNTTVAQYLRRYFRKYSTKNESTSADDFLTRRQNSSISSQKARLEHGVVITKSQQGASLKPLVVILGWNDCTEDDLGKYSSIFEKKEWSTICLPTKESGAEVKKITKYMAEVIKDHTEKDQPVFLYAFSNGGCAVYLHLAEALTMSDNQYYDSVYIIGCIFDSCSVRPTGGISQRCPQLFLYSKADYLAVCDDIEEHLATQESQGLIVFRKCWEDSSHVQHYMKYPDEYVKSLEDFTTACLKKHKYDYNLITDRNVVR